jgi:ASC-1-like (ASCH) protein
MMLIKKKIWPEYFELIKSGKKKYELRLNDFEISKGDTLLLEEWDPATKTYTGRNIKKKVGFVGKFSLDELFWPKEEIEEMGLLVISLND